MTTKHTIIETNEQYIELAVADLTDEVTLIPKRDFEFNTSRDDDYLNNSETKLLICHVVKESRSPYASSLECFGINPPNDLVIINPNSVIFWMDDIHCLVRQEAIIAKYDPNTKVCYWDAKIDDSIHCWSWPGIQREVVTLINNFDDELLMLNQTMLNGMTAIGRRDVLNYTIEQDIVVFTTTDITSKHIRTPNGEFYVVPEDAIVAHIK